MWRVIVAILLTSAVLCFAHADDLTLLGVGNGKTPTAAGNNTFDPATKTANITLSNGNLTATTSSNSNQAVVGTNTHSTGKFYAEFVQTAGDLTDASQGMTLMNASCTNGGFPIPANNSTNCVVVYTGGTSLGVYNGSNISNPGGYGSFTHSTVFQVAVDIGGGKLWVNAGNASWNGTGANPAGGTGGLSLNGAVTGVTLYTGVYMFDSGSSFTANYGATSYTYTPPAGFGNW